MLVFGLISPHPPIIIPAIGKDDTKTVAQTTAALDLACQRLGATKPDKLIIIAPHEGHGFEVPLYYLKPYLSPSCEVEEILVTEPSYGYYYQFGTAAGQHAATDNRRIAIVASGDLSHVLKDDGPYGFNAAGPELDRQIVAAITAHDDQALLHLDPTILEDGAECGLRSILFLLGAIKHTGFSPHVMSYEGPFGVGYLVATYSEEAKA